MTDIGRRQFVRDGLVFAATAGVSAAPSVARDTASTTRIAWLAGNAGPLPTPAYLEALLNKLNETKKGNKQVSNNFFDSFNFKKNAIKFCAT